ncbi:MAG: hypothetical protein RIA64_08830 [Rhodospirillales bacterium]
MINNLKNIFKKKTITEKNRELFYAVERNDIDRTLKALRNGANPNAVRPPQEHILVYALDYAGKEVFDLLVDWGADVNQAAYRYPGENDFKLSSYAQKNSRDDLLPTILQMEKCCRRCCDIPKPS